METIPRSELLSPENVVWKVVVGREHYFEVGDLILYGKYKNKKGVIRAFSHDAKGNPTVEIEPFPKGRKQNKVFGLFLILRAPTPDQ